MKKLFLIFSILLISFIINGSELDIKTKYGVLQGKYLTKNFFTIIGRQFLGIPFAAPPVNNLRWKPPQSPSSWSGVRDAKDYGNNCWQSDTTFTPSNKMSEDCLYLDLYLPLEKDINETLPVMIFFYGGSWQWGAASWPPYSGKGTLENGAKVIVINANYRLGPLGFFGFPYMKNISEDGSVANYGLQDQRAAMQWIQDNIAAFGGDPKRVTIWGESAGAGSVSNHLVDKRSWGLFSQGIMESGPIGSFWIARPLEWVYIQSSQMISNSPCSKYTNQDLYNCLSNLNATELMKLPAKIPQDNMITWGPCVDGVELTDLPGNLAAKGEVAPNVNVLFGTNKNEGSLFTPHLSHDATVDQYINWAHTQFKPSNESLVDEVLQMYPVSEYDSPWWAATYIVGDSYMSCPARRTARWISNIPGNKVYLYFWDYLLLEFRPDIYLGVFHGSEIPFVFNDETGLYGDIPLIMTSAEETLAKNINTFWTSFVINGVPSVPGLPAWPAYTLQNDASMILNMNSTVVSGLKNLQCNLWDKIPLPPYVPSNPKLVSAIN